MQEIKIIGCKTYIMWLHLMGYLCSKKSIGRDVVKCLGTDGRIIIMIIKKMSTVSSRAGLVRTE